MKFKITKIVLGAALLPCLMSANTDANYITVEWHALTQAIKIIDKNGNNIESSNTNVGGVGHSYVRFINNRTTSVKVGYFTLEPKKSVTVGLWNESVIGSSSSSSFISSSSSPSGFSESLTGVLYDYEQFYYTTVERPQDLTYTTSLINTSTLEKVSDKLKEKNNSYNLVTYNCATFATDIWNIATGSNFWTGWFRSPQNCINELLGNYKYQRNNYHLTNTKNFYKYSTKKNTLYTFTSKY